MEDDTKRRVPPPRKGPRITADFVPSRLVANVSKLYAQAAPEDQLALRVWMRDTLPCSN